MKNRLFATTAAITLLSVLPAMATTEGTTSTTGTASYNTSTPAETGITSPTVGERVDRGLEKTGQAIERTSENIRDLMRDRTTDGTYNMVSVNPDNSVSGILGQDVFDVRNQKIATVEDILFDLNGNATRMVLSNGGIMGIGDKLVVVDFGMVYARTADKDVIVPITEEAIKRMAAFSYNTGDASKGMQTLTASQISAKAMLEGELVNERGGELGSIENITIDGAKASQVIVAYNTTLGMGGEKIAIGYDQLQRVGNSSEVDFRLPATLTARYETYTRAD